MQFKIIAAICLPLVFFSSCAMPTSQSSYPYEIGSVSSQQDQIGSVIIAAVGLVVLIAILVSNDAKRKAQAKKRAELIDAMLVSIEARLNAWKGAHITEVIRVMGPPTHVVSDGGSGKIHVWTQISETAYSGIINRKRSYTQKGFEEKTVIMPPGYSTHQMQVMIWANSQGIVHHWKLTGL